MTDGAARHPDASLETGTVDGSVSLAVTPHYLASRAAVRIMQQGGNAVDGAVAANAVLSVVAPDTCGPGGDLFALVYSDGRSAPTALNASGKAGSGADGARLRARGFDEIPPRSPWTITVPGCVDGWETLLSEEGTATLADALAPAIELARDGFPVSPELAGSLRRLRDAVAGQASAPPLYPDGRLPQPGDVLRRPRLADTLTAIGREGREAFYSGAVGQAITEVTTGMISSDDLRQRQAEWVTPISLDVFGATGWTTPPNTQGYLTLAASWVFERFTTSNDPQDPAYQHALIEAYRAFAWELEELAADPATTEIDPAELLATERLTRRLEALDADQAVRWPPAAEGRGGTAFMCTRDGDGTGVALIQSNYHGIGTALSAGNTGVFLHDRGAGFNLIEGHPNELKPGRRPLHTLSPSVWTKDRSLVALLGTRGGPYQPQLLLQVAANMFRATMTTSAAVRAPRFGIDGWGPGGHHSVTLEPDHTPATVEALSTKGHNAKKATELQRAWGPVSAITAGRAGFEGVADPRVATTAALASA